MEYRPVKGYEGIYIATSDGNVINAKKGLRPYAGGFYWDYLKGDE